MKKCDGFTPPLLIRPGQRPSLNRLVTGMSVITIQNHRLIGPRIFKVRACEPRIRTCLAIVTRAQQSESNGGEEAAGKEKGWLAGFLDFNSWAPRSARMWRLNQYDYESSTSGSDEENGKSGPIQSLSRLLA